MQPRGPRCPAQVNGPAAEPGIRQRSTAGHPNRRATKRNQACAPSGRQIGYLRAGRRPIANLHALRSRLRSSAIRVDVERAEPEFAQPVRGLFDGHRHKTIATVRADRSPRISGIQVTFEDGELAFGSMPDARKGADLGRDPRFELHSATIDPVEDAEAQWPGKATISGRAIHAGPLTGDPAATASRPTSPRSCTRTSTRRPRCSSLSAGSPRTDCAGSSASNPRPRAVRSRVHQTIEMLFRRRKGRAPRARPETLAMPA